MTTGQLFPIGLRLIGRRCVVVGGGKFAHRRVAGLLEVGARVRLISPQATPALEALASSGAVQWERRPYAVGGLAEAWYVVAATGLEELDRAVAADAEAGQVLAVAEERKVFCVRADDAARSSAWTLAGAQYGDMTVAVSGGGDPRRAAALRDAIAEGLADGSIPDRPHRRLAP